MLLGGRVNETNATNSQDVPPPSARAFLAAVEETALIELTIVSEEGRAIADQLFFGEGELAGHGYGIYGVGIHVDLVALEDDRFKAMVLGTLGFLGMRRFACSLLSDVSSRPGRPSEAADRKTGCILVVYTDAHWYQKLVVLEKNDAPIMEALLDWCRMEVTHEQVGRPYAFLKMAESIVQARNKLRDPVMAREGMAQLRKEYAAILFGPLVPKAVPPVVN
jgi:hypothetical protein